MPAQVILEASAASQYVEIDGFPYSKEAVLAFVKDDGTNRIVFSRREERTDIIAGPVLATDISVDGGATTFATFAAAVAWLKANFFKPATGGGGGSTSFGTLEFLYDGEDPIVIPVPYVAGSIHYYMNGLRLPSTAFTELTDTTLTLNNAPVSGADYITLDYQVA